MTPVELAQTRRLLLAKQLLTETSLPIIDVAFASGFESVRRFNALFRGHYRLTPSLMRRSALHPRSSDSIRLTLAYRPPYAWDPLLGFLGARCTAGVECVEGNAYMRTVALGPHAGWLKVEPIAGRNALAVELATSLTPALPALLGRLRRLFDLDARPDVVGDHLRVDRRLAALVDRIPGLRLPGAFDGFEVAVRAILGQRISVPAATTVAGRLAHALGEPVATPFPGLNRLAPSVERLRDADPTALTALGIPSVRADAIQALARAVDASKVDLSPGTDPESNIAALMELPGVGPWTANYIAMRALHWPDAFPAGDLVLLRSAAAKNARELSQTAEAWRPWRAYAALYLWQRPRTDLDED